MPFQKILGLPLLTIAALVLASSASPTPDLVARDSAQTIPFHFTELFTVTLEVGKILKPLDIPGGVLVNEPITGGIVRGPAINGTIDAGFAHPSVYGNGTLQVPAIDVYGTTDDGQSFYIHEEGIGLGSAQVTRIVISVGVEGDKYRILRDSFIIATVNPNANKTAVSVRGFAVVDALQ